MIDVPPHQHTSRPQTLICSVELLCIKVSEFEMAPVMQAWSHCTLSCQQALPIRSLKRLGNIGSRAGDQSLLSPGSKHIGRVDAKHVTLFQVPQIAFEITNAIHTVCGRPAEWQVGRHGTRDRLRRQLRLRCKANLLWNTSRLQASRVVGPALRQIECPVKSCVGMARYIRGKDANLPVGDLPRRTRVLPPPHRTISALLQEAGFIDHQNRVVVAQMFKDILAYKTAQRIGSPTVSSGRFLLPPRASITRRFRAHPAPLTLLVAEQSIQKQAGIRSCSLLREQLPHPTLHIPQSDTSISSVVSREAQPDHDFRFMVHHRLRRFGDSQ